MQRHEKNKKSSGDSSWDKSRRQLSWDDLFLEKYLFIDFLLLMGVCIIVSEEVERLRIQSHRELEMFVKKFAKKYRSLFRNGTFGYRIHPNLNFLYEVYLEIKLAE